jgi:O-methyltransferase involved in polyketide biosynthesis
VATEGEFFRSVVPEDAVSEHDFDTSVAHPARIWNAILGGKDNFAADRAAAEALLAASPVVAQVARADRAFLASVVRYLVDDVGIRQFLDIGTGLPTADNTHEVAQRAVPETRIVYVDNDPIVLAHARALLTSDPRGATAYIEADLRDTQEIMAQAGQTLDLSQPVAVLLLGILPFIPDADEPHLITANLLADLVPGSYLAISHGASDIQAASVSAGRREYNQRSAVALNLRTRAEVTRLFGDLELVPPGVAQLDRWQPGAPTSEIDPDGVTAYGALGRKP